MIVQVRQSLRKILTDEIEEVIDGKPAYETANVVAEIHERLGDNDEYRALAAREAIDMIVPVILREILSARRDEMLPTSSGAITVAEMQQRAAEGVFGKLGNVMESSGGVYKSFLTMVRPDLLEAAESREKQAAGTLRWAGFERACAALLPDDVTPVKSIPEVRLTSVWNEFFAD